MTRRRDMNVTARPLKSQRRGARADKSKKRSKRWSEETSILR